MKLDELWRFYMNIFKLSIITLMLSLPAYTYCQKDSVQSQTSNIPASSPLNDPDLSTFAKAVKVAGINDLFVGTGSYTGFIPSNAAFEKFGKDKLEILLKPENRDQLTSLLIYHVVSGKYLAANLRTRSLKTINGKNLEINIDNIGNIKVNNAKVIKTDMVGPNGVIHEIDTVLIP